MSGPLDSEGGAETRAARQSSRLPRGFRRNVSTGYLVTAASVVSSLVVTPVLIAGIGTEAFGVWVLAGSLILYRDILEFGLATAIPKYVAEFAALGERDRLRAAIATSVWLLAAAGALALALGVGFSFVFGDLFGVPSNLQDEAQILVVIVAVNLAIAMPGDTFSGVLTGMQRFDILNLTLVVINLAQAGAIVIVVLAGGGLVALGVATAALAIAGQIWRYVLAKRLVPELSLAPRSIDRGFVKPLAGFSIWLGLGEVATIVLSRIDVLVVGAVLGVQSAGIFAVGQKLASLVASLTAPSMTVFFPHASELMAHRDSVGLRNSLITGSRIQLAVAAPLAVAISVFAGPGIEAWVGSGFEGAVPVVAFLAASACVWAVGDIASTILEGSGQARAPGLIRGGEAVLNLGLSITLANAIGLEGVALATLATAALMNLLVLVPYACRRYELRALALYWRLAVAHLPAAAITVAAGLALAQVVPSTIPAVVAAGAATVGLYLLLLAFTGAKRDERRAIIRRLRPA